MKTCIIIDDEQLARETLQKMIERYCKSDLEVCSTADSVKEGVEKIKKHNPDIVFLDIEMPEENGLQLFKYFEEMSFDVVFTTAYEQYAINAIKYSALDYILKPINQIDLSNLVKKLKLKDSINLKTSLKLETLLHNLNIDNTSYTKVAFPTAEGCELEKIRNIVYCQADVNYSKVYCIDGNVIHVSKPLKFIAELLPSDVFFRVHKSYLVNLNYIKKFNKQSGGKIVLDNGEILPVAVRNCDSLMKKLYNK